MKLTDRELKELAKAEAQLRKGLLAQDKSLKGLVVEIDYIRPTTGEIITRAITI